MSTKYKATEITQTYFLTITEFENYYFDSALDIEAIFMG